MVEVIDRRAHPTGARFSWWMAADGWKLRVMEWPHPAGGGARGSLLFLGGHGDFAEKYIEAMHHWHEGGWHVTTFDWRGQGGSRGGAGDAEPAGGFDVLVADLESFSAAWIASHPGPHVAVAHSMGGHILLRALAERRLSFSAAVLVAPMIAINAGPIRPWFGRRLAHLSRALGFGGRPVTSGYQAAIEGSGARQNRLTSSAERYADEKWWQALQPAYDLGTPTWDWIAAAYLSMTRLTPEVFASVRIPLLILAAPHDRLVDTKAIKRAVAMLPDAEMIVFPHAAHEILRESDAVRLPALARIDAFFARHAA